MKYKDYFEEIASLNETEEERRLRIRKEQTELLRIDKERHPNLPSIPPEDLENFLNGVPYVKSPTNFCLGTTLEEAGKVIRELVERWGIGEGELERLNEEMNE